MLTPDHFGTLQARLRQLTGQQINQLAETSGVSRANIYRLRSLPKDKTVRLDTLQRLDQALHEAP